MDLMMERTEKTTEAMGMEGRQATLYKYVHILRKCNTKRSDIATQQLVSIGQLDPGRSGGEVVK
jgi:hypothetical protein